MPKLSLKQYRVDEQALAAKRAERARDKGCDCTTCDCWLKDYSQYDREEGY